LRLTRTAAARIGLLALIWGSNFLWIKLSIRGLSPAEVTCTRLALGAAVLFTAAAFRRERLPRSPRLWAHILTAALFANAAPYLLFAVGELHVASSTAGMLNTTTPLWTVLVALAAGHQKSVTVRQAAGLVIGFGGALLVFAPWQAGAGLASAGAIECLAGAASYGISYVYMDRYLARRGLSPVALSACQLLCAAVLLAIPLAVTGTPAPRWAALPVVSVLVLGLIGTGGAYVLNYQVITSDGATVASTVTYLLPIVAIALGVLVLRETITPPILAGIALIVVGVFLARSGTGRRAVRPREAGEGSHS
jgi:drug/metabolite transporter (DMT)-like permease